MSRDPDIWLKDILQSIEAIDIYLIDVSLDQFIESQDLQDKVIRRFSVIGEAVNNLSAEFKTKYPHVEWERAYAMRNILIHEYFDVDYEIVWKTAQIYLPNMKKQINKILEEIKQ